MPKYSDIAIPTFYEDQDYKNVQANLFPFGTDILKGDIPDYYKPIGEYGGKEFEDMLGLTTRDITQAGLESGARMGMRGPRVSAGISRSVGDATKQLRYEDYARAIEGRKGLLDTGIGVMEGVGNRGLEYGSQKNQFNLNATNIAMKLAEAEEAKKKATADRWAKIIESGVGLLGTAAGFAINPASAATKVVKGAASGGGNFGDYSMPKGEDLFK